MRLLSTLEMNNPTWLCFSWSLLILAVIHVTVGEMYTSLLNVKQAISVERKLIDYLRVYIDHEFERLEDIKRLQRPGDSDGQPAGVIHPDQAAAFRVAECSLQQRSPGERTRSSYEKEEANLPKLEDLQGAAKGLMRLQDVYALQVASLVRGCFQRVTKGKPIDIYLPAVSVSLSGDDCFLVGKVAYEQEDYYHSVQWLEESVRLFRGTGGEWSPENEGTLADALDHLAFSHFKTGNISYAISLSQELLNHDPMNGRVLQNIEKYEKLLGTSPPIPIRGDGLRRPSSNYLGTRDTYERLCQTQGSQPMLFENPRLFCDYFTNGNPGLLLLPVRREVLSLRPYVVLYHSFITDTEAEDIKRTAQPGLKRSVVAAGEKQATAEYRISKSAWLKGSAHSTVGKLDQRISMLTGLNVKHPYGEYLQVVNYGIGGHYEPHFDHATLSSVEAGGCTAFIYANFSVPVMEKAAIFWWNLHRNGQGDADTLHAGCPVLIGDKWVANKWIHEHGQEFQHRCSLNPEV
ncbi:hypothetical protein FQN60_004996 [Etheostoma spectabile]|uniref:procollagen-proline 4-dioxygenase n=1 Tax=Etheostoma spectabile TaxID=54343 RepID=A0A5J5DLK1_9PERO|nr:hypothetical protein FQN60_004996 [Etheostoma spectabile]